MSNRAICWLWLATMILLMAGGANAGNDWLIGMALTGAVGFGVGLTLSR